MDKCLKKIPAIQSQKKLVELTFLLPYKLFSVTVKGYKKPQQFEFGKAKKLEINMKTIRNRVLLQLLLTINLSAGP